MFSPIASEIIETSTTIRWRREDGIIYAIFKKNKVDDLDTARENVHASLQLNEGKKRPLLIDLSKAKRIAKEARDFYMGEESAIAQSAVAFVTNSSVSKMIGSLYIQAGKFKLPVKLFTSQETAVRWLREFL